MTAPVVFSANRPTVISETFGDEVVVVNLQSGSYYSLEREAACAWTILDEGSTEADLVDRIAQRYAAPHAEIAGALKSFLAELQHEGLVTTSSGDAGHLRGGSRSD